jgi:hypothetical protein
LKLHVAPNNGDRHFSELFILGLYLQLKLFRKIRNVTVSVSSIISALISCNFIIKNYINRKITSYIYLLIFTKSLWLHVKHFIALTKRESVRRIGFFCCNYRSRLPLSTHRPVTTKNTGKYDSIGDKKGGKRVRINKGNNKITEHRTILQRESQNS